MSKHTDDNSIRPDRLTPLLADRILELLQPVGLLSINRQCFQLTNYHSYAIEQPNNEMFDYWHNSDDYDGGSGDAGGSNGDGINSAVVSKLLLANGCTAGATETPLDVQLQSSLQ